MTDNGICFSSKDWRVRCVTYGNANRIGLRLDFTGFSKFLTSQKETPRFQELERS